MLNILFEIFSIFRVGLGKPIGGLSHPNIGETGLNRGKVGETKNMHLNDNVKYSTSANQDLQNTIVTSEISFDVS